MLWVDAITSFVSRVSGPMQSAPAARDNPRHSLFPSRSWSAMAAVLLLAGMPVHGVAAQAIYAAEVAAASQRFAIPEDWIRAVMRVESAGDRLAVSPRGAVGLMQVTPATWAGLRARHGLGADPFAPQDNILAGTAYLREMLDRFGSLPRMLAAYNAGPGRVEEHLATGRPLPAETWAYVATLVSVLAGGADPAALRRLMARGERGTESVFVQLGSHPMHGASAPTATIFVPLAGPPAAASTPRRTQFAASGMAPETRGARDAGAEPDRLFVIRGNTGGAR